MTSLQLKVIGSTLLGLSLLTQGFGTGPARAEPLPLGIPNPAPFPRDVGNQWVYGVNRSPSTFEKHGAGTLTLMAVNSWTNTTEVLGGTLRMGVAGALPNGRN